ncbi:MAG: hypothetical protein JXQ29_08180 [Planctomycetes bacterium]|nr:hypothetical protein [Planctomycetota bacterium]
MRVLGGRLSVALLAAAWLAGAGCSGGSSGSTPPGFSLALSQHTLLLVAGRSGDIDVRVAPTGGFSGTVTLSVVGAPAGLVVTLAPTSIPAASGTSRLRVEAPPATTPGDYPLTVHAASGDLTREEPLTVTVVLLPPQRFSLALDLETLVAPPVATARTTIDVSPIGGFADPVSLVTVGVPAGITAVFTPATVPGGSGRVELSLAVGASVSPGAHGITVRGTGGSYTEDLPLAILVPPAATAAGLTLQAAPYVSLAAGRTTAVEIGIQRAVGVVGGVDLALVDLPPGMAGTFSESPCVTAGSLLTLQAAAQLAPGVYPLGVRGTTGASSGSVGLLVEVGPATQPADVWISRVEFAQTVLGGQPRLVPGKAALVRAHVLADAPSVGSPRVLVTAFQGASTLGTLVLTGPTTLPTREEVSTLALGFTASLPPAWVAAGLELKLEVDPARSLAERNERNNAVRIAPAVARPTRLELTIVPILLDGRTGTAPDLHPTLDRQWPLGEVAVGVRHVYAVTSVPKVYPNGDGWSSVLAEIAALRQADHAIGHYYGVIKTDYGSGVAGMAYVGYPVAIGMDTSTSVASHELGHTFGLRHAPCGNVTGVDANYPYPGGLIGSWGYHAGTGQLLAPASTMDLMSYCTPTWISDYHYRKAHAFLEPAAMAASPAAPPEPALIVSGTIDADGRMRLMPLLKTHRSVPPHTRGDHWLVLENAGAGGGTAVPFLPVFVGCGPAAGKAGYFTLVVPDRGPLARLRVERPGHAPLDVRAAGAPVPAAALSLVEQSGQLVVRWSAVDFPHATVAHVGARRTTLGLFLAGGEAALPTRGLPRGGHFEVTLSRDLAAERFLYRR